MQHRADCRHLLQGETVDEHETTLDHAKGDGAAAIFLVRHGLVDWADAPGSVLAAKGHRL